MTLKNTLTTMVWLYSQYDFALKYISVRVRHRFYSPHFKKFLRGKNRKNIIRDSLIFFNQASAVPLITIQISLALCSVRQREAGQIANATRSK
jgi:hypothetical protein